MVGSTKWIFWVPLTMLRTLYTLVHFRVHFFLVLCTLPVSSMGKVVAGQVTVLRFCALLLSYIFSLPYFPSLFLFYIVRNFVKMIAVLLILDKCNLYISQNTKFVKTMDMKIQYDTTPIERCNFRSLFGETSCFSI